MQRRFVNPPFFSIILAILASSPAISEILLSALPPSGVLLLSVIGLLLVASMIFYRGDNVKTITIITCVPIYLSVYLNVLLIGDLQYGGFKLLTGLWFPIICYALTPKSLHLKGILLGVLIFASAVAVSAIFYKSYVGGFWQRPVRFGLLGSITFAWMMAAAMLVSIWLAVEENKRRYVMLSILFATLMLWSGSRGPTLLSLLVASAYVFYKRPAIVVKSFFVGVLAFFPVIILYPELLDNRILLIVSRLIDAAFELNLVEAWELLGLRGIYWGMAFASLTQWPFTGIGLGNFPQMWPNAVHIYPHNFVLEALSELGWVIGVILFSTILYRVIRKRNIVTLLAVQFGVFLLVSGDLSYARYMIFFLLLSGGVGRHFPSYPDFSQYKEEVA
ncbi:O-antigen ligase family protein [Pelagibacterium sp. H642]|uniref:O-antigen ligase family protein n=1 Tax=Pelagibacterium sp. H642 TaxID=1881069 RepID=UPI002814E82E|nr:O-antigen ligase family protein [Pelagibacterium sp. H642]WMT89355.1 O-antigen ligase family protein [Pelagibacterium sp. H642]